MKVSTPKKESPPKNYPNGTPLIVIRDPHRPHKTKRVFSCTVCNGDYVGNLCCSCCQQNVQWNVNWIPVTFVTTAITRSLILFVMVLTLATHRLTRKNLTLKTQAIDVTRWRRKRKRIWSRSRRNRARATPFLDAPLKPLTLKTDVENARET